jgi:rhizoxin synthesis polyketide synthase RhiC
MACQSLRTGECEMALAGGVHVGTTPHLHVVASNAEMLSPSGRCRTFDEGADGFVPGEGVGAIVLKPLAAARRDGDHVYGVIRGSGINQDGRTNGITAPSTLSQTELLSEVYRRYEIDPSTIGYVEAHGTGTRLGDPIEVEALTNAFRRFTDRRGFCPIGSVKSNIGHTIAAAGIAGVIKILLALEHRQLPPSLHISRESEHIDFAGSPFYPLKTLQAWPAGSTPRRAAVSSFGFSGTNAHLVIEEPPPMPSPLPEAGNPYYLIPLSAKTDAALERRLGDLHDWLKWQADRHRLADVAYTLSAGRVHFDRRCAFVVRDLDELRQAIDGVRCGCYPDSYRWCDTGQAAVAESIGRTPSLANHNGSDPPAGRERLLALAQAYVDGQEPAWCELFPAGCRRSLRLPTYPFARERYWIDLPETDDAAEPPPEAGSDEDPLQGYLYAPYWEAEARQGTEIASGRALIVYAAGGEKIAAALRALHGDAVELFLGETTERQAPQRWQAGLDDPEAYTRMLREIGGFDVVYHLAGTGLLPPKLDSLEAGENRCVISLFRLAKALAGTGFRDRPLILKTVTSGASAVLPGETANPLAASLWGFARSLAKECPDWRVSCIDVAVADKAEKVAAAIAAEAAPRGGEAVAWRGSERYVRKISPIDLSPACETRFKTRGVYLILGGAGGVGQAFSRYLAERFNARLALVGRSPSAPDAAIANIEAAGGEMIYLQADLTDPLAVHDALAQMKRRFGHIDGVIHSAMVFAPVPLAALEELQLRDTLAPKVRGTLALVEALQGERLDFLLFFSSAQSFTGNAGRAHYAAACTFQDAFASGMRGRAPYPVQIINWGFWATNQGRISDALHRSTQEEEGAYPLTPEEGSEAVRRALGHNAAQLLVLHVREHVLKLMGIEMATRLRLAPPSSGAMIEAIAAVPPPEVDAAALARGMEALSRFGAYALLHAFRRMGVQFRPGLELEADGLKRKLGVVAHYDRLFEALIGVLEKSGHITRAGGLIRATERIEAPETLEALRDLDACATQTVQAHPGVAAYVKLVRTCLADYPEILRGSVKATDVIFPGSSMDLVGPIYGDNPLADYANELVAQAVSLYIERRLPGLAPGRRIRILEIGAGTGGTTRPLLERIGRYGDYLEYLYTDLSLAFTQYGNRAYGERFPFLQFRTFDIELPLESQGLTPGRYDLVLASNVLHATRRIRATLQQAKALLAGNGWLILNELTYTHNFSTLTFGTLDGWWLFEDPALRMPASPLLDTRTWRRLLGEQGFVGTLVRGVGEGSDAIVGQHVLIAQSDGLLKLGGSAAVPGAVPALVDATPVPAPPSSRAEAEAVVASLVSLTAQVLQIPATAVDIRTPLMDLGLDSLLAQDLVKRINRQFDIPLTPTTLFDHATLVRLGDHIDEAYGHRFSSAAIPDHGIAEGREAEKAQSVVSENQSPAPLEPHAGDIAVVGVACRFPGARTAAQFWGCLAEGRDLVDEIRRWPLQAFYDPDPARHDRSYCKYGGLLSGIDEFDPLFFSLSPKQAELMDPRQRLFLQEAWSALEDAGYSPQTLTGKRCGVFVGCEGSSDYFTEIRRESEAFGAEYFLGNSNSILAARIAYYLDLKGPSITIDTACSSSLVALHLACESIRGGESDMALAGGVMIMTRPDAYIPLSRMGMLSPQGKCRAFDAGADGFVPAEGVGVTLLKPLAQAQADGDQIYGVIKATGINQDGKTNGITAPSAASQAELERRVYARFAIDPTTISYVEAHGTGTQLGDPVEFEALKSVYGRATDRRQFCALGSVKTNMGHAGAAAGVAGLVKVLLAMRHRLLPPSLHFERANEQIDFETSPFYLNTGLRAWTGEHGQPLRAAVSSFGHSGTNAHAVIEEAPAELSAPRQELPLCLIPLSAKSEASLRQRAVDLRQWIEGEGAAHSLSDIAFTLQVGRGHFPWRLVFLVSRTQGLLTGLERWLQTGSAPDCWSGGPQAQGSDRIQPVTPAKGDIDALRPWAEAYADGMELNWQALWPSRRQRISLPTYPFSRDRFWLPPSAVSDAPRSEMLNEPVLRPERDPSRGGGFADGRFLPEVVLEKPGGEVPNDETLLSLFGRLERGEIELAEAEQCIEAGGSA